MNGENWLPWSPCSHEIALAALESVISKDAKVLDVGCGRGETLAHLAAHTNWLLWGVDPAPESARKALPAVKILSACAESLPFSDGFFDAVIMECVFSLCDDRSAAKELERVLRPGGRLILTDLYSRSGDTELSTGSLFRKVVPEEALLHPLLERRFRLCRRQDYTRQMQAVVAQMIFNDEACIFSPEARPILRACRAGYALWELERI